MNNQQLRHVAFTWNNYTEEDNELIKNFALSDKCSYMIVGYEEAPSTGTKHLQGYMQFSKRIYFSSLKKLFPKIHITICKGTSQQNIDYCKKAGTFWSSGEPRLNERGKNKDTAPHPWEEVIALAKQSKLDILEEQFPKDFVVYYNTLKRIAIDNIESVAINRKCLWIYGDPGVGKSRVCHKLFPSSFWKNGNKWWDGYQGEQTVVLDDLDNKALFSYLKRWADRYKVIGEVKGSSINLTYQYFVVTSNYRPSELYNLSEQEDTLTTKAVERRFLFVQALQWSEDLDDLLVKVGGLGTSLVMPEQPLVPLTSVLKEADWDLDSLTYNIKNCEDFCI